MKKKIISILVCILLITTILPLLKLTEFTQGSIIKNDKESFDCFLGDDIINYEYENYVFADSNAEKYHIVSDDIVYYEYVLSDPVEVKIRYTDSVKNIGARGITVKTRYAIPPTSPTLANQVVHGEVVYNPDVFSTTLDNWLQPIAIYERLVYGGVTSTTYYEVEATIYNITYDIDPDNVVGLIPFDIMNAYTADATMYNITNPIIQNAVQDAIGTETNLYWKAKLLHDYVKNHLYYDIDGKWDEAPIVLSRGNGSCSEYSWLYIALCRAAGIPARYVGGTVIGSAGITPYNDSVFHRWTQIYLPNYGWVPVDVTWDDSTNSDQYFGATSNRLFVTTICGGPSNYLGWTYNCIDSIDPKPFNVEIERVATWLKYDKVSPYAPKKPDGLLSGTVGVNYEYTTSTIEPGGDPVWFWFDWGDNTASGWLGSYRSGEECTASHTWKTKGSYQIKVKAKDMWGYESDWSKTISVSMPKNKVYINTLLLNFLQQYPILYQLLQRFLRL